MSAQSATTIALLLLGLAIFVVWIPSVTIRNHLLIRAAASTTKHSHRGKVAWWSIPPGSAYGVVLPETRSTIGLAWIVNDTLAKIPPSWTIEVHHVRRNADIVQNALRELIARGRVRIRELPPSLYSNADLDSNAFSNAIMLNTAWWEAVGFDKFLLMQSDSGICTDHAYLDHGSSSFDDAASAADEQFNQTGASATATINNITDLLEMVSHSDYAGAPWREGSPAYGIVSGVGGNGGFSWRSRPAALAALRSSHAWDIALSRWNLTNTEPMPEDIFYSVALPLSGFSVAPRALCCAFAVETASCNPKPFGIHAAWKYNSAEAMHDICPVAKHLQSVQR